MTIKILVDIEKNNAYANLLLPNITKKLLREEDRDFVIELTYGVLKQRKFLDYLADKLLQKRSKLPPFIINALRVGLYQLYFLDKVPVYAAINETVAAVKKHRKEFSGLVNGVLRNFLRNKEEISKIPKDDLEKYLAIAYSHPEWMVERWLRFYGDSKTQEILRYNNSKPKLTLRVNTLKIKPDQFKQILENKGIKYQQVKFLPEAFLIAEPIAVAKIPGYHEGLFYIQDIGSLLISHIVEPRPGTIGLDACAAPGGKTTHLAQLMQNKGKIFAFDVHPQRVSLIEDNAHRLGIDIIQAEVGDATKLPFSFTSKIDWILADVPCSGTGVLARRPDARWQKSLEEILSLSQYQLKILVHLAKLLPPEGSIVYSTCSIEEEENEKVVEKFLENHPDFMLVKPPGVFFDLGIVKNEYYVKMLPGEIGDGFFGVKLKKVTKKAGH